MCNSDQSVNENESYPLQINSKTLRAASNTGVKLLDRCSKAKSHPPDHVSLQVVNSADVVQSSLKSTGGIYQHQRATCIRIPNRDSKSLESSSLVITASLELLPPSFSPKLDMSLDNFESECMVYTSSR